VVPRSFTTRVALGMVAVAAALRAMLLASGYFYWDDFILSGRAAKMPLLSFEYLFYNHDGHFMPGAFVLEWLVVRASGLNYSVAAIIMLIAQLGAWYLWWRLLQRTFANHVLILVPLALVLFSPLTWPSMTWWSAALNALPLQYALIIGIAGVLRLRESADTRARLMIVGATIGGLLFFEKAVIVPVAVFGLAIALASGSLRKRVITAFRLDSRLWTGLGIITAAYLIGYATLSPRGASGSATVERVGSTLSSGILRGTFPALLGGPWHWDAIGWGSGIASPPTWAIILSALVITTVVALTSRRQSLARWVWLWAGMYLIADMAIVVVGRLQSDIPPEIAASLRYTADALIPLAFALAVAIMATVFEPTDRSDKPTEHASAPISSLETVIAVCLACVVTVGVFVTAMGWREILRGNYARTYVTNATATLGGADPSSAVLSQPVPTAVLYGLAFPYNQTEWFFAPLRHGPQISDSATQLRTLNSAGELGAGALQGTVEALKPKPGFCPYKVTGTQPTKIPLRSPIFDWSHTVGFGYLASADSSISVSLGNPDKAVIGPVTKGLNSLYVTTEGGEQAITLQVSDPNAVVCLNGAAVGTLVASSSIPKPGDPAWLAR